MAAAAVDSLEQAKSSKTIHGAKVANHANEFVRNSSIGGRAIQGAEPRLEARLAVEPPPAVRPANQRAHVVVVGNQKGGSGKSTAAMHIIAGLLSAKKRVAALDLDVGQESLRHYIENRMKFVERNKINLPMPSLANMPEGLDYTQRDNPQACESVGELIRLLIQTHDFVVIDTPGNDTMLSRVGHSYADTLLTPLNDSFVDLDVLGLVDSHSLNMIKPSNYANMVFQVKIDRAKREQVNRTFDWIVTRNRTTPLESNNEKAMTLVLDRMAKRLGYRLTQGFSERVIFRELFLDGLTLLDLRHEQTQSRLNLSHVAARQEVRNLLAALRLPL